MNSTKWRISKACHECRAKKIRCNGEDPCERCKIRGVSCVYREKARNRARKRQAPVTNELATSHATPSVDASDDGLTTTAGVNGANSYPLTTPGPGGSRSIHIHSVAATHRASPSCLLQLYYGPSSNFALLNSIYHQIEGTRPNSPSREGGVEEVGPSLDLFRHRRLFFGDLADTQRPFSFSEDCSAMLLDPTTARRLLERYLSTYWHGLPVIPKDVYRRRLDELFRPPAIFSFDAPDTILIMMAIALGACMTGEDIIADFLFQKAKLGAAKLDEVVNVQVVQIHLIMISLDPNDHEDLADIHLRPPPVRKSATKFIISLYRPECTSPDRSQISPLAVWNAAMEIRRELHQFAEQQLKDMKFGLVGDLSTGELGVCQAMVSTMYHHTLLLTFRPFLILRAKLRQDSSSIITGSTEGPHTPPAWLHSACEYCLEAARNTIGFLSGACEANVLCHDIKYHGFFIEGACYVLAFDMLQERNAAQPNLPWIRSALKCLRSMLPTKERASNGQLPFTIAAIEQMVRSVIPDFELKTPVDPDVQDQQANQNLQPTMADLPGTVPASAIGQAPAFIYPSMPFGFDLGGRMKGNSPSGIPPEEQMDFTAADVGWDIDFGTMDMEAFLSIDPNQNFNLPL
ncbi:Fc.00g048270.m01.CDS01 [Cosmosporella sp. VM-42]